jgi:hypothetical protein
MHAKAYGNKNNEITSHLAKMNLNIYPFMAPEPACSISKRATKWVNREWSNRKHQELHKCTCAQETCHEFPSRTIYQKNYRTIKIKYKPLKTSTQIQTNKQPNL